MPDPSKKSPEKGETAHGRVSAEPLLNQGKPDDLAIYTLTHYTEVVNIFSGFKAEFCSEAQIIPKIKKYFCAVLQESRKVKISKRC